MKQPAHSSRRENSSASSSVRAPTLVETIRCKVNYLTKQVAWELRHGVYHTLHCRRLAYWSERLAILSPDGQ